MMIMMIIVVAAAIYAWQGIDMHNQVTTEEARFHQLQDSYFSQSKAIRDAAGTDSQLNKDLVAVKNYPSTLLQLKLVGVGKILTGIFLLLFAILMALIMMPIRLAKLLREHQ